MDSERLVARLRVIREPRMRVCALIEALGRGDPPPAAVAILLEDPRVTEADVLQIAAARPAVPEALAKLAVHPRWSVRHAVKRALVQNPATPLADAIRIAMTLGPATLAEP